MKKLDTNRSYGIGYRTRYAFEQDGLFFDQRGDQVNEDGSPIGSEPQPEPGAAAPETASAPAPAKRGPKPDRGTIDVTVPYERQAKPKMRQLRARFSHITGGKRLPAGTSIEAGKNLIREAIAEAAR